MQKDNNSKRNKAKNPQLEKGFYKIELIVTLFEFREVFKLLSPIEKENFLNRPNVKSNENEMLRGIAEALRTGEGFDKALVDLTRDIWTDYGKMTKSERHSFLILFDERIGAIKNSNAKTKLHSIFISLRDVGK